VTTGTDGGDGCGLLFNAVVGTGGDADQGAFIDFPATDGMPLPLNTHSPISGVISLTGAQVGLAEIDVTLEALITDPGAEDVINGQNLAAGMTTPLTRTATSAPGWATTSGSPRPRRFPAA
jgi:hypothetical protein